MTLFCPTVIILPTAQDKFRTRALRTTPIFKESLISKKKTIIKYYTIE